MTIFETLVIVCWIATCGLYWYWTKRLEKKLRKLKHKMKFAKHRKKKLGLLNEGSNYERLD